MVFGLRMELVDDLVLLPMGQMTGCGLAVEALMLGL